MSAPFPLDPDSDPFSPLQFTHSQEDAKYGNAWAYLNYAEHQQQADARPYTRMPAIDIKETDARRWVAWWTTLSHRIRMEGSGVLVPVLRDAVLQEPVIEWMLHRLLSTPPSEAMFRLLIRPHQQALLRGEAARRERVIRMALEVFWGEDVLRHVPASWHADILAASAAYQAAWSSRQDLPLRVPRRYDASNGRVEGAGICHFVAQRFRAEGMIEVEGLVTPGHDQAVIAEGFLAYALAHASQIWRDRESIECDLRQQAKTQQAELGRRLGALTACLGLWLAGDVNPNHVLWRMNSFWPEPLFADYHAAQAILLPEDGQ